MLSSNRRPRRRHPPVERPTPHWFTLGSLRSFGTRLRNPPPPSNEEHYVWLVKPKYTVRLEDVVADKHLPPLSRHDFEEYLYYVEGSLRNLYFHEWVHHYRQLFEHWAESVLGANVPSSSKGGYRPRELWERLKNCQDPRLRKEFALAKDTFFRPGASMRLNIPSEYLDCILLIPNAPPPYDELELTDKMPSFPSQPEPGIFDSILKLVRDALNTSFATFIKLAFSNAGLWHCVPGACGGALIVAGGLAMWSIGMTSHRRGYVVGSLPIIWIGMWFMLVTLSGHCLTVYVTGDARQLYPWETERPLPPEVVPPSVYSLTPAPAPEGVMSTPTPYQQYLHYSSPLTCRSLSIHQHTHLARTLVERRWSEGILKMLGRDKGDDGSTVLARKTEREPSNQLPPARKTKGLARNSLTMDAEQVNTLEQSGPASVLTTSPKDSATDLSQRRNAVVDISMELAAMGSGAEGRPDSPLSEENDFGIVLSEAFEEDEIPEMHHFSTPSQPYSTPTLTHDKGLATRRPSCSTRVPNPSRQAPLAPLLQPPEHAVQRRRTMPDILAPVAPINARCGSDVLTIDIATRRGSKSSETEQEPELYWPWARNLYGPMTLVHSPLVRRAHWVTTWRTAAISTFVTFGLALGLIH